MRCATLSGPFLITLIAVYASAFHTQFGTTTRPATSTYGTISTPGTSTRTTTTPAQSTHGTTTIPATSTGMTTTPSTSTGTTTTPSTSTGTTTTPGTSTGTITTPGTSTGTITTPGTSTHGTTTISATSTNVTTTTPTTSTGTTTTPTSSSPTLKLSTIPTDVYIPSRVDYKMSLTISIKAVYNVSKTKEYEMEFKDQLTHLYVNLAGFIIVEITSIRNGSIVCDHIVVCDALVIDKSGDIIQIAQTLKAELHDSVKPLLKNISVDNGVVDVQKYEDGFNTAIDKTLDDPCGSVTLQCAPGYGCPKLGTSAVCQSLCETEARDKCGSHRTCALDKGKPSCICQETDNDVYTGDDCNVKVEKFRLEKDKIIAIGAGVGGGILLISMIILIGFCCKLNKSKKKSKEMENEDASVTKEPHRRETIDNQHRRSGYANFGEFSNQRLGVANDDYLHAVTNEVYAEIPDDLHADYSNWQINSSSSHKSRDYEFVHEARLAKNLMRLQTVGQFATNQPKL